MTLDVAWIEAEALAYSKILEATGTEDGKDAFLGALPHASVRNYVAFVSGGGGAGDVRWSTGQYCALMLDASLVIRYVNRSETMRIAGLALEMLNATRNMKQLEYVEALRPTANPTAPVDVGDKDGALWSVTVPLLLVVRREKYTP